MRILHVHDNAGVAGLLAKYQRYLGHDAIVVCRDGYDGLKQKEYYGVKIIGPKRRRFLKFGLLQKPLRLVQRTVCVIYFYLWIGVNAYHFDIVHIHSQYLVSLVLPFKKKVVEFHGDDIRKSPTKRWLIDQYVTAIYLKLHRNNMFIVSTPDLLNELTGNVVWLPNPVDTDLFKTIIDHNNCDAVYFHNWYESGYHAKEIASRNGLNLTIVDRVSQGHLMYRDMPSFVNKFSYMIDRKEIHSLSKTALECLASGLKVIDYDGVELTGLPPCHEPLNVAKQSIEIYNKIMEAT